MKKFISLILTAVLFCSSLSGMSMAATAAFTDVSPYAWYYSDVNRAVEMGLIGGKGGGRYAPEDNLTYAEAIKLAACMHKKSLLGHTIFDTAKVWYQPYVTYAEESGIKLKNYDMNAKITRSDFLDLFSRALPSEKMREINNIGDGDIPDVPMTYPNAQAIYKLYRVGIVGGSDAEHNCRPGTNILRSEVATILVRMMDETARLNFKIGLSEERMRYNTGYGVYDAKLAEYYDAVAMSEEQYWARYGDDSSINMEMLYWARDGGQIEFALYDIDGNGIDELFILMGQNIIDIYTTKDGSIVKLFADCAFGERIYLEVLSNGALLVTAQNGAYAAEYIIYRMDESGGAIKRMGAAYHDESGVKNKPGYEYLSYDQYTRNLQSYQALSVIGNLTRRTVADSIEVTKEQHYDRGTELFNNKSYIAAAEEFALAEDYENAASMIYECYYCYGKELLSAGYVESGVSYLTACGDYRDAPTVINEFYYTQAKEALKLYLNEYETEYLETLEPHYEETIGWLELCAGYKDADILNRQVTRTFKAKKLFSGSGYSSYASFDKADLTISGDNVTIVAPEFTDEGGENSKLVIKYNAKNDTFTARWTEVSMNRSFTSSNYVNAWSGLMECFTGIANISNLKNSYADISSGYWSENSEIGIVMYTRSMGNYMIKTMIGNVDGTYELNISAYK